MSEDLWRSLLTWYAEQKRDLPWRHTRDPYAILVAETMLQQTGVDRVIPKYEAFLHSLPTLESLASAPPSLVIRLWSGLGYNRRAVRLQQAARRAVERWGHLLGDVNDLLSLPGIGPYTARAVACFAFDAQVPVCDTNVQRVLTRLFVGPENGVPRLSQQRTLALAESVLPPGRAYEWNQALMDLGATICTAYTPLCLLCPVGLLCCSFPLIKERGNARDRAVADERPRWKTQPFHDSRRYYRGRIVEALRRVASGGRLSLAELGTLVKNGYTEADRAWLLALVQKLEREELAAVKAGNGEDMTQVTVSLAE